MGRLTTRQIEKFHRGRKKINRIVKRQVKKNKSILYGQQALNLHLDSFLQRPTIDFDVYSKTPKKSARQLEKNLDRGFNSDLFFTKPAQHPGTTKVMNRVTEKEIADFSRRPKSVVAVRKGGVLIVPLTAIEQSLRTTLKDKESAYRHPKDRDSLRRIQVQKRMRKRPPRRRSVGGIEVNRLLGG